MTTKENNFFDVNIKKLTEKEKRFIKLANKRLSKTIQSIVALEKLFNKSNYSYDNEWILEVVEILENCIQEKLCESSKINKLIFTKRNKDIKEKKYAEIRG